MAKCPNCGRKLHLYDWRPECPGCGVNMIYFKSNERILAETEKAEIEHARSQPGIDRAKASFFGSPIAIARTAFSLLAPLGSLMLPLCRFAGAEGTKSINAIGVYNYLNSAGFGPVLGKAAGGDMLSLSLAFLLLSAVMIIVCVLTLFMSLGKHGKLRNLILDSVFLAFGLASAVCFTVFSKDVTSAFPQYTSASLGAGAFVYLGVIAAILIINLVLAKVGLPLKYTQCLIGGLPSEEYFAYVEQGMSELEIRKKMVEALTKMQDEVRAERLKAEEESFRKSLEKK